MSTEASAQMEIALPPYLTVAMLEALVAACLRGQDQLPAKTRDLFRRTAFLAEYCTVKVQGPRRSGHTRAAVEFVKKTPGSIYVTGREFLLERLHSDPLLLNRVFTFEALKRDPERLRGMPLTVVVVDDAYLLSDKDRQLLLQRTKANFAAASFTCYVFVG